MLLKNIVSVSSRFQRSVNIELDALDAEFLESFVSTASTANLLLEMSRCVKDGTDSAFTWTGPYGSGKSSLALALSALLSANSKLSNAAWSALGEDTSKAVLASLAPKFGVRRFINIVGSPTNPEAIVRQALENSLTTNLNKDAPLFELLSVLCKSGLDEHDGFVFFVDEMGKFLEAASNGKGDVFFFQQLAEFARRSEGRLILVGVLHVAFSDYSGRLPQAAKREWLKVAGRFNDLGLNISGEEQLDLISKAIEITSGKHKQKQKCCDVIANEIQSRRRGTSPSISQTLMSCWPLHPAAAPLIGPISKRQFGQNQRSIFGFLNSAELSGFRDFLSNSNSINDLYLPSKFWDYLSQNLSAAIYNSPDGHRWSLISDAVQRCEAFAENEALVDLMKSIAVLDFCKDQSGVFPTRKVLQQLGLFDNRAALDTAISKLESSSCIIYRNYQDCFTAFAGSDFDIEQTLQDELQHVTPDELTEFLNFAPFVAKEYYHSVGSLKWFQVKAIEVRNIEDSLQRLALHGDLSGIFLLCLNDGSGHEEGAVSAVTKVNLDTNVCVGLVDETKSLRQSASELVALSNIEKKDIRLKSDSVARQEVAERIAFRQQELETQKYKLFANARWFDDGKEIGRLNDSSLNKLASQICTTRYSQAPKIKNELLNRQKPSSSARAAQNEIMKLLVAENLHRDLGISGNPAEWGLLESILKASGLISNEGPDAKLVRPSEFNIDPLNLKPLWTITDEYLSQRHNDVIAMPELFELWQRPPLGIARGLHPLLGLIYFLTSLEKVAIYRDGVFQTSFTEADADLFGANQKNFGLRWMELNSADKELMSSVIDALLDLSPNIELHNPKAIDVARGIVSFFDQLHPTTSRTLSLPKNQLKLRDILKNASDPQDLLFVDIKEFIAKNCKDDGVFFEQLTALKEFFATKILELQVLLQNELRMPNNSGEALNELNNRAKNILGISGNMRLESFCKKLVTYRGTINDMEGVAALVSGKPTTMWFDQDFENAKVNLQDFAREFRVLEAHANLLDRPNLSNVFAILQKDDVSKAVQISEFSVLHSEQSKVEAMVAELRKTIDIGEDVSIDIQLAALFKLATEFNELKASMAKETNV